MKLKVFFAKDGDCLLLTTRDGRHVLVDGGRTSSFEENTRPLLQELAAAGQAIDLVVVSHIDADHISGILSMLEDVAAWAVFDYQVEEAQNPTFPQPRRPRPPQINGLWHNSWRAQLGDLAGPVNALARNLSEAVELSPDGVANASVAARAAIDSLTDLAESISDGVRLLTLVEDQTPISLNLGFRRGLVMLRDPAHLERIGTTTLTVLGPSDKHLRRLRDEWRDWLEAHPGLVRPAERGAGRGVGTGLAVGGMSLADGPPASVEQAQAVISATAHAAQIITKANAAAVTAPNRASITLLVEENGRTLLLTGDAAEEELIDGLAQTGHLAGGTFRCDVLKVQHHGSEFNLSTVFAAKVIADHYVFCGDGAHGNPSPSVVRTIIESRLRDGTAFTLWFNCSENRTIPGRRKALAAAIREARQAAARHTDLITVNVLDDNDPFFEIEL